MTSAIIMAAVQAISAGIGAYSSYKARKQQEKLAEEQRRAIDEEKGRLDEKEKELKLDYEKDYYKQTMDREENLAAMSVTKEAIENQTRRDDNRRAMMGGSEEQAVANRAKNMELVGSLARDLSAAGQQYKQQLKNSYQANLNQLWNQRSSLNAQSAALSAAETNAYGQAAASGTQLMTNGISAAGDSVNNIYIAGKSSHDDDSKIDIGSGSIDKNVVNIA